MPPARRPPRPARVTMPDGRRRLALMGSGGPLWYARGDGDLAARSVVGARCGGERRGPAGCGGEASAVGADAMPVGAPDAPPDAPPPDAYDACAAGAADATALLAGIDHVIVLCMENRSFNHALGALRLSRGAPTSTACAAPRRTRTPAGHRSPSTGSTTSRPPIRRTARDACHAQWNEGANDGFVRAHAGASQADVMGYHVRAQLPITWALADQGAVCNRWFASVMGPTWPNRFYLHGATAKGQQSNLPVVGFTSIWDRLADAGVSGTNSPTTSRGRSAATPS